MGAISPSSVAIMEDVIISPSASTATLEVTAENVSTDSLSQDSLATEWTNEKHSLYLKSMETSFVNDLYDSFDLLGWRSQKEQPSDPKFSGKRHASARNSSGQFKVLRSGCWEKINFEKHESQLNKADGSGVLLANPWIRHFRSAYRQQNVTASTLQEKAPLGSPAVRVSRKALISASLTANFRGYDSVGSNAEVTDQNFVDDNNTEGEKASRTSNGKRMRTSVVATPSNDQVVPFGKFPVTANVTTKNSLSLKREGPRSSRDVNSSKKDGFP